MNQIDSRIIAAGGKVQHCSCNQLSSSSTLCVEQQRHREQHWIQIESDVTMGGGERDNGSGRAGGNLAIAKMTMMARQNKIQEKSSDKDEKKIEMFEPCNAGKQPMDTGQAQ